jgi:hypothetical protein
MTRAPSLRAMTRTVVLDLVQPKRAAPTSHWRTLGQVGDRSIDLISAGRRGGMDEAPIMASVIHEHLPARSHRAGPTTWWGAALGRPISCARPSPAHPTRDVLRVGVPLKRFIILASFCQIL